MTVHLLNTAMMPAGNGTYRSQSVSEQVFAERAREAHKAGTLKTYIGYEGTAYVLSRLCGFEIRENRKETRIEDGDILLIARLKYRLGGRVKSDMKPRREDLEFRIVYYHS